MTDGLLEKAVDSNEDDEMVVLAEQVGTGAHRTSMDVDRTNEEQKEAFEQFARFQTMATRPSNDV
jgi:hypothetical protein